MTHMLRTAATLAGFAVILTLGIHTPASARQTGPCGYWSEEPGFPRRASSRRTNPARAATGRRAYGSHPLAHRTARGLPLAARSSVSTAPC